MIYIKHFSVNYKFRVPIVSSKGVIHNAIINIIVMLQVNFMGNFKCLLVPIGGQ